MYRTINKILFICVVVCLLSCKQSFEEIPSSVEVVNGFIVEWRRNVSEAKKNVIREILNDMVYVEGGLFLMGATQEQENYARSNEKPAHYVRISDYYIGRKELSIEQIETLLNTEFSSFEKKQGAPNFLWDDWAYVMDVIEEYTDVKVDFPTEAQWEYAARGGVYSKGYIYPKGNTVEDAELSENELGLVELTKGHSEWCKDAYNEYSNFPLEVDPYCMQGRGHVVRGGNAKSITEQKDYLETFSTGDKFHNCYDDVRNCRVSARSYCDETQSYLNTYITCRLVINNIK